MFYKDNNYIGAIKPYGYPEEISFSNKKVFVDKLSRIDHTTRVTQSDFTELPLESNDIYNEGTDFGSMPFMGLEPSTKEKGVKVLMGAAVVGLIFYMYKNK